MWPFGTKRTHRADAVITGAGSGIGAAFARELAHRGGRVVCSDIDLGAAQAIAEGKAVATEKANVGSRQSDGARRVRAAGAGKPRRAE